MGRGKEQGLQKSEFCRRRARKRWEGGWEVSGKAGEGRGLKVEKKPG